MVHRHVDVGGKLHHELDHRPQQHGELAGQTRQGALGQQDFALLGTEIQDLCDERHVARHLGLEAWREDADDRLIGAALLNPRAERPRGLDASPRLDDAVERRVGGSGVAGLRCTVTGMTSSTG